MEKSNQNEKSRFFKSIAIFMLCEVFWCVLLYGIWSFVQWDAEPSHWTEAARGALAYFGIALGLIVSGMAVAAYNGSI